MTGTKNGISPPVRIAQVGFGGWGRNLARNYAQMPEADLRYICDLDENRLKDAVRQYPSVTACNDYGKVLADPEIEAIVIATGAVTHFELARQALLAGKDVYVEKPMVLNGRDGEELVRVADERGRILMVGHLLEYHPVVLRLRDLVRSGELGRILYVYTQRVNLGTVREDENAMWSLAPHDISSVLFLLDEEPTDVAARGQSYLHRGVEDVVFMSMNFGGRSMAHVHVSWLDPHKVRKLTVVGSRKMAVFDDVEGTEKLRIYDKGAEVNTDYESFAEYVGLRFGDIVMPYIKAVEPLRLECQHFVKCVRTRMNPVSDGRDGLRVTRVLEAAQKSLEANGDPVSLEPPAVALRLAK